MPVSRPLSPLIFVGESRADDGLPYEQKKDVVYAEAHGTGLLMDVFTPTGKPNGLAIVDIASGAWYSDRGKIRDHTVAQVYTIFCSRGYMVFAVRPGSKTRYTAAEMDTERQVGHPLRQGTRRRVQDRPGPARPHGRLGRRASRDTGRARRPTRGRPTPGTRPTGTTRPSGPLARSSRRPTSWTGTATRPSGLKSLARSCSWGAFGDNLPTRSGKRPRPSRRCTGSRSRRFRSC